MKFFDSGLLSSKQGQMPIDAVVNEPRLMSMNVNECQWMSMNVNERPSELSTSSSSRPTASIESKDWKWVFLVTPM